MALVHRKAFLEVLTPIFQCKRFRGKVNVQRPKPAHFEKAKYLALAKPWYINPNMDKKSSILCKFNTNLNRKDEFNPLQSIYAKEIYARFTASRLIIFYHHNSIKSDEEFKYYAMFKKQGMELKKYGNKLISSAVKGTFYENILDFYVTHNNMILFCSEPEISKVLKISKKCPKLILLAAIFENKLIDKDDLLQYSKIPNIEAAQAELVQTMNRVGNRLVSDLNSHQSSLVFHLDQRIGQLKNSEN